LEAAIAEVSDHMFFKCLIWKMNFVLTFPCIMTKF
jgi:hypothetical protein